MEHNPYSIYSDTAINFSQFAYQWFVARGSYCKVTQSGLSLHKPAQTWCSMAHACMFIVHVPPVDVAALPLAAPYLKKLGNSHHPA